MATFALTLASQSHVAGAAMPTHAWVTFALGEVPATAVADDFGVWENAVRIPANKTVASTYPDGQPRVLHCHFLARWDGSTPRSYEVRETVAAEPSSSLSVTDGASLITVDTGQVEFDVSKTAFAGLERIVYAAATIVNAQGGPELVDEREVTWVPRIDDDYETVQVIENGAHRVVILAESFLAQPTGLWGGAKKVAPEFGHRTYIIAYADSPIIRIEHRLEWRGDRYLGVRRYGWHFRGAALSDAQRYGAAGAAVATTGGVYLHQHRHDSYRHSPSGSAWTDVPGGKLDGWFTAGQMTMLTLDFWQKHPGEVHLSTGEATLYLWPLHGKISYDSVEATSEKNIHRFLAQHQGSVMQPSLDPYAHDVMERENELYGTTEWATERADQYQLVMSPNGSAWHTTLWLHFGISGSEVGWHRLLSDRPLAHRPLADVAASGVFVRLSPKVSGQFDALEQWIEDRAIGFLNPEKTLTYGRWNFGDTHHSFDVLNQRPNWHRCYLHWHYHQGLDLMRQWARGGSQEFVTWARRHMHHLLHVDSQWFDFLRSYRLGTADGLGDYVVRDDSPNPQPPAFEGHRAGAFQHKAGFHWSTAQYGMYAPDTYRGGLGHWTDPTSILFLWYIDADLFAREFYEDIWYPAFSPGFPASGTKRENNTNWYSMWESWRHFHDAGVLAKVDSLLASLVGTPLSSQAPGPIWQPFWVIAGYEHDPASVGPFAATEAPARTAWESALAICLSVVAYEHGGETDDTLLTRYYEDFAFRQRGVFEDVSSAWHRYASRFTGALGDGYLPLQWSQIKPHLLNLGLTAIPALPKGGYYLHGNSRGLPYVDDARGRGCTVAVNKTTAGDLVLDIYIASTDGGDPPWGVMIVVDDPDGNEVYAENQEFGDWTYDALVGLYTQQLVITDAGTGLYLVHFGANELSLLSPLQTTWDECCVMKNVRTDIWPAEDGIPWQQRTHMYVAPCIPGNIQVNFTHTPGLGTGTTEVQVYADNAVVQVDTVLLVNERETASFTMNDHPAIGPPTPYLMNAGGPSFYRLRVEGPENAKWAVAAVAPDREMALRMSSVLRTATNLPC